MKLSLNNFLSRHQELKINEAIELGGGVGDDAKLLASQGAHVIMIDKKPTDVSDKNLTFLLGDYFDSELQRQVTVPCDLLLCSYSLCFNHKEKIEEFLPFYLNLIRPEGIFLLYDFTDQEKQVTKREKLWNEDWFNNLLSQYFSKITIQSEEVFEEGHGHTHNIFELAALKKGTSV